MSKELAVELKCPKYDVKWEHVLFDDTYTCPTCG
ncbi:hypothetical protein LCGC14_3110460, partial [marine sediment metagenome]